MTRTLRLLLLALLVASPAYAVGPVNPTTLTWTEPQTNADGSPLVDLAAYRVETAQAATGPWLLRAGWTIPAPLADPAPGATVTMPIAALVAALPAQGQWFARVFACDTAGNCSTPTVAVPFERDGIAPSPPTGLEVR